MENLITLFYELDNLVSPSNFGEKRVLNQFKRILLKDKTINLIDKSKYSMKMARLLKNKKKYYLYLRLMRKYYLQNI